MCRRCPIQLVPSKGCTSLRYLNQSNGRHVKTRQARTDKNKNEIVKQNNHVYCIIQYILYTRIPIQLLHFFCHTHLKPSVCAACISYLIYTCLVHMSKCMLMLRIFRAHVHQKHGRIQKQFISYCYRHVHGTPRPRKAKRRND